MFFASLVDSRGESARLVAPCMKKCPQIKHDKVPSVLLFQCPFMHHYHIT